MRVLALDIGQRRVGVAISDPDGLLATPLTVLDAEDLAGSDRVTRLIEDHGVELVVVGLPLTMGGEEGPQASSVRAVAEEMARNLPVPVHYHDERLSTAAARRALRESGRGPDKEVRGQVDKMAAAVFLQSFLDSGGARGGPGSENEGRGGQSA